MPQVELLTSRTRNPASEPSAIDDAAADLLRALDSGYPVVVLKELLHSSDAQCVRAAIWIASELGDKAAPLVWDVVPLLDHSLRYVRFFAVDVVLASAGQEQGDAIAKAITLIEDPDEAIRWKALQFLSCAAEEQLRAAIRYLHDGQLQRLVRWLIDDHHAIVALLDSDKRVARLFAVAAAARVAFVDSRPLTAAADSSDSEVATFAREQLDLIRLRRGE